MYWLCSGLWLRRKKKSALDFIKTVKFSKKCPVWGSNSRPSDFYSRLWDWRAAYCANEAPVAYDHHLWHSDWLQERSQWSKNCANCKDQCNVLVILVIFRLAKNVSSLLPRPRIWGLTGRPRRHFGVYIQKHERTFRQLLFQFFRQKSLIHLEKNFKED